MVEIDKENLKLERTRLREMVDELLKIKDDLTEWEYKFVNKLFLWTGEFRPRQKINLIRVYNKYFSKF